MPRNLKRRGDIIPLRAIDKTGVDIFSFDLTEQDRRTAFYCPICNERFIVVLPQQDIIKHFRHKTEQDHGEPETEYHILMKYFIQEQAVALGYKAQLEVPVQDRIVDVLIETPAHQKDIAVECQCSPIAIGEFKSRTYTYRRNELRPLWILGPAYHRPARQRIKWKKKGKSYEVQRISDLELQMILTFDLLVYFDEFFNSSTRSVEPTLFRAFFKPRYHAKKIGWFRFYQNTLKRLLSLPYIKERWSFIECYYCERETRTKREDNEVVTCIWCNKEFLLRKKDLGDHIALQIEPL